MNINNIIQLHSNSVAVVFSKMGINSSVTKKDLLLALVLYKQPLIDAIGEQIEADEYTGLEGDFTAGLPKGFEAAVAKRKSIQGGFNGTQTLQNVTVTGKKKSQKAKGTLLSILDTLVTSAGAYVGAKNKAQGQYQNQPSVYIPASTVEDKKKQNQKYFLIGGIAVILILVIVLLTQKNK